MKDMNIAKLTSDDLPLFTAITSDLFPGIDVPTVDYEEMNIYITIEVVKLKLQVTNMRNTKLNNLKTIFVTLFEQSITNCILKIKMVYIFVIKIFS